MKNRHWYQYIRVAIYIAALIIGVFLPYSSMQRPTICLFYNLTGKYCAACGATRAFLSFMRLDFAHAAAYNPIFTYAIFPLFALLIIDDLIALALRLVKGKGHMSIVERIYERMCGR